VLGALEDEVPPQVTEANQRHIILNLPITATCLPEMRKMTLHSRILARVEYLRRTTRPHSSSLTARLSRWNLTHIRNFD
jgi:hypothetical protein